MPDSAPKKTNVPMRKKRRTTTPTTAMNQKPHSGYYGAKK